MTQNVPVTPAEVAAAKAITERDSARGRETPEIVRRIAEVAAGQPIPLDDLAELNPGLDQRGLRRLQAFEQLLAEDDQACGYQDPED
jgi:hypothetical protein